MEGSDGGGLRHPPERAIRRCLALLLLAAVTVAGCEGDALRPSVPEAGPIFERYVAMGNSITAGFQSGGINDSTQSRSYAVMLADGMGTRFEIPALRPPGCPPPLTNVFTRERVAGGAADDCALRETPVSTVLNNVAVPGAEVLDALTNLGPETSANALTTLLLGGRTQLQAAARARPTFVSVWLGNNDVLGAATAGNPSEITPAATFADRYAAVLDSLERVASRSSGGGLDGVLVGVTDVTLIPYLSPGAAYWQAEQSGALPPTLEVDDDCAPGAPGAGALVPFGYGFGVLLARAGAGQPVALDCLADPPVLTPGEVQQIRTAVQAYNTAIAGEAEARGWAYFDPNPLLAARRKAGEVPLFPHAPPDPRAETEPFGPYFSRDGIHPSTAAHRLLAGGMASAINDHYDTDITLPEAP